MPSSSLETTEAADADDDDADEDDDDDEPNDEDEENEPPNMAKAGKSTKGASKSAPAKRGNAKTTGDKPISVDNPPPRGGRTTPSNGR